MSGERNLPKGLATGTNDDAAAGFVGELLSNQVLVGAAVGLTSTNWAQITSITLTPGDWDVSAMALFTVTGTTSVVQRAVAISQNNAAPDQGNECMAQNTQGMPATVSANINATLHAGPHRIKVASGATSTVYLLAYGQFSVSTMTACGFIRARRMR
jgi:hypothetical protein